MNQSIPPLYFTILVHREVSNDDRCGVGWCDEWDTGGGGIATGHWDRVSRSDASRAAAAVPRVFLSSLRRLHGRGGRRGGPVLLLHLLQLEGSDVNHGVGVHFAPGGGPGDGLGSVRSIGGWSLAFTAWSGKSDTVHSRLHSHTPTTQLIAVLQL